MLKAPTWEWHVAVYFFLGGASAGSFLFASLAELFGHGRFSAFSRNGYRAAFAAFLPCPGLLIADLGRPERFLHMLRVFKPSSPMNLGSWTLAAYSLVLARKALGGRSRPGALGTRVRPRSDHVQLPRGPARHYEQPSLVERAPSGRSACVQFDTLRSGSGTTRPFWGRLRGSFDTHTPPGGTPGRGLSGNSGRTVRDRIRDRRVAARSRSPCFHVLAGRNRTGAVTGKSPPQQARQVQEERPTASSCACRRPGPQVGSHPRGTGSGKEGGRCTNPRLGPSAPTCWDLSWD